MTSSTTRATVTQARAVVRADGAGRLTTWPLAVVRHAKARPVAVVDAARRPNSVPSTAGRGPGRAIAPLLAAYGVTAAGQLASSVRCADTIKTVCRRRWAGGCGSKDGLSEEGYEADPTAASRHLRRLLDRGAPAVVCSHGPVLPDLLHDLAGLVDEGSDSAVDAAKLLDQAAEAKMAKGEVLD